MSRSRTATRRPAFYRRSVTSPRARRFAGQNRDGSLAAFVETLEQKQMLTNFLTGIAIDPNSIGDIKIDDTPDPVPTTPTATLENGVLRIRGTDQADQLYVRQVNGRILLEGFQIQQGDVRVDSVVAADVTQILIQGHGGSDTISLDHTRVAGDQPILAKVSVWGGEGNDVIVGSAGRDYLAGESGDDRIYGGNGDDVIIGGMGDDFLSGGNGNDRLHGDWGNDMMLGGNGDDQLYGGDGSDWLYGQGGVDWLYGQAGDDLMLGGIGNDTLLGGADYDTLYGEDGNDWLYGENGLDTMHGGNGFDVLTADRAGERLTSGEHVRISIPTDQPQTDGWSCGPNSASRILRAYGYSDATYANVREAAQRNSVLSRCGLGTTPANLVSVMKKWKADAKLERHTSLSRVVQILKQGKPINALIRVGTKSFLKVKYPLLHWVALTGYNQATDTLFYTDTDGSQKSMSTATFVAKWNWSAGRVAGAVLSGLDVTNRTIVY